MQDPVNASPAVLVKRYNISQQKRAELQLMLHEEALQRHAPILHTENSTQSGSTLELFVAHSLPGAAGHDQPCRCCDRALSMAYNAIICTKN